MIPIWYEQALSGDQLARLVHPIERQKRGFQQKLMRRFIIEVKCRR